MKNNDVCRNIIDDWIKENNKSSKVWDQVTLNKVINENKNNYNYKISTFRFKKGILKLIKDFLKKNFYIFIITNQAGIAKKKYTLKYFLKLQKFIKQNILNINLKTQVNDIDNNLTTLISKWNSLKKYVINNKYKL